MEWWTLTSTPIDAIPDLSDNRVKGSPAIQKQ
jgi:Cu/Ag efflux pump CusA